MPKETYLWESFRQAVLLTDDSDLIYTVYRPDLARRERCKGAVEDTGAFAGGAVGGSIGRTIGGLLGTLAFEVISRIWDF